MNEQSGNSGQLQGDAGSGGDAPIDVTDPWRGLYRAESQIANGDGNLYHPDLPSWPDDREDALDKLVRAQGFDFQIVAGDFSDEATEDGDELYWQEMRAWNPEAPEGDWRLAWKGDTEDGPYAWFVRPMALRPDPEILAARPPVEQEPVAPESIPEGWALVDLSTYVVLPQLPSERMIGVGWPASEMISECFDSVGAYADLIAAYSAKGSGIVHGKGQPAPAAVPVDVLPPLPIAFFDEFGQGADDRVQDYVRAALAAPPAPEMSPDFTDTARAAISWVLWHHQGGSSAIGQPLRYALGMGDHEALSAQQISEAKRYAALVGARTDHFKRSEPAAVPVDVSELINAFDDITGLCRHLRQGGPDADDLQGLSDGLEEAIDIAARMLARFSDPSGHPGSAATHPQPAAAKEQRNG